MNENNIKALLNRIYSETTDNLNIHTPFAICREMINSVKNLTGNILVISNLEFLIEIKNKLGNLNNVWYSSNDLNKQKVAEVLGVSINKIKKFIYNKEVSIEGIEQDMKFDVIVMNPPYGKLHIPFLKYASEHRAENGEVVSIQPIEKFQTNYDKNDFSWLNPTNINVIKSTDATKQFDASFAYDLGIIHINDEGGYDINQLKYYNEYFNSVNAKRTKSLHEHYAKVKSGNYFVEFALTHGNVHALDEYELFSATKMEVDKNCKGSEGKKRRMYFDTKIEAENFIKSCRCITYYFLKRVGISTPSTNPMSFMPFMQDYTKVWTDKDYCDIFGLDYEIVKHEMGKYIAQVKKSYPEYEPNI